MVVSGALEIYFSFQENKVALAQLQREKAWPPPIASRSG